MAALASGPSAEPSLTLEETATQGPTANALSKTLSAASRSSDAFLLLNRDLLYIVSEAILERLWVSNEIWIGFADDDPLTELQSFRKAVKPRQVAVAIPVEILPASSSSSSLPHDILRVYLVSSRKHSGKFVLPKGGVESGEHSRQAAVRELWEEAGLVGQAHPSSPGPLSSTVAADLTIEDQKPHKNSPVQHPGESGFVPRAVYTGHEVLLAAGEEAIKDDWPEAHERRRKAFTVQEAEKALEWRPDIHTIFKQWAAGLPPRNT
ncbi:hypothetical protein EX895_001747 [Sporisorium graminicola]|uniref:Nudix hydrolase domain-containing protein n=1 Tax=Sporisorium graminicola TaxID=280036 RepID=A0A4U7KY12_9BASI|nr:hypothetical protein EX895_001747 [Sporisorium graminicola]TKY89216.1 hypothetical protein EX895_001747 [Sporisorium graminicola]